jgi:ADP-ribose pyrophosphatase YjhB (NUDIX family)
MKTWLVSKLQTYKPDNDIEQSYQNEILSYIQSSRTYLSRTDFNAHVTGSAFVISKDRKFLLLTHHKKLDIWIQLGGHCDGKPDILKVAWREVIEESGLTSAKPISEEIFDLDIQKIPSRKDEPSHRHMDIRFLFEADKDQSIIKQDEEAKQVKWVALDDVKNYTKQASILRAVERIWKFAKKQVVDH